jgi:hypothetical protein
MPNFYPEGDVSLPSDDAMRSLHKLVNSGGGGSGTGNLSGVGSPEGVQAAEPGTLYVDTSTSPPSLWAKATGSGTTGWVIEIEGV